MRILNIVVLSLVLLVALALPVLAQTYYADVTFSETSGNSYDMYPALKDFNTDYMASENFCALSALDTRVLEGTAEIPHMMADNKLLFATDLPASSSKTLRLTTGNSLLSNFEIITGRDGDITTVDNATLELSANFTVEQSGWVDTTYIIDRDLVDKEGAFKTYISATENVTSEIRYISGSVTISTRIQAGMDDVYRRLENDDLNKATPNLQVGDGGGGNSGIGMGLHFTSVNITQGTDILSANFTVQATNALAVNTVKTYISAEDEDNPADFTADDKTTFDARYANRTTAIVAWDAVPAFVAGVNYTSSNITTVIQEIINRPGWSSGNSIVIFWEDFADRSDVGAYRDCDSQEGDAANAPILTIEYATYSTRSVTASGVTSGEHRVTTSANITTLWIAIDGTVEDSIALGGVTVPDNANALVWTRNNSMPYSDNMSIEVNGTQVLLYEPTTYIVGNNLPDLAGASQNGIITWGTNDTGVSVVVGSLVAYAVAEGAEPEVGAGEAVGEVRAPGGLFPSEVRMKATLHVLYPVMLSFANVTDFPVQFFWWFGTALLTIAAMVATMKWLPNIWWVGVVGVFSLGMGVGQAFLPGFFIILGVLAVIFAVIVERTPSM